MKTADGTEKTFEYTDHAAKDMGKAVGTGTEKGAKVTVYSASFAHLGQPGQITRARLYVSVSLYFLLGLSWFGLYTFLNAIQPGAFAESGATLVGRVAPSNNPLFQPDHADYLRLRGYRCHKAGG